MDCWTQPRHRERFDYAGFDRFCATYFESACWSVAELSTKSAVQVFHGQSNAHHILLLGLGVALAMEKKDTLRKNFH